MSLERRTNPEELFLKIARLIEESRARIATSINLTEVYTKYRIGQYIFEEELQGEERAQYGKQVLQSLSTKLTEHFGIGWSYSNLRQIRQFYLAYSNLTATGCQIEDDTPHFTLSYTTKRAATAKWLPAWAMSGRGCAAKVRISEGRLCLAARGHRGCCGRHGDRRGRRWRCCLRFGR
mgnify:CR=1 FL=1